MLISWIVALSLVLSFRRTNLIVYTLEQRWEILRHYFEIHGNVAECVRKLRTDLGRREAPSAPYVRYLVKKVMETGILIDKSKREKAKNSTSTREYCCCGRKCVWSAININSSSFSTIEHFGDIIETNFALGPWYDAIQNSIGLGVEANWPSNAFSLR